MRLFRRVRWVVVVRNLIVTLIVLGAIHLSQRFDAHIGIAYMAAVLISLVVDAGTTSETRERPAQPTERPGSPDPV